MGARTTRVGSGLSGRNETSGKSSRPPLSDGPADVRSSAQQGAQVPPRPETEPPAGHDRTTPPGPQPAHGPEGDRCATCSGEAAVVCRECVRAIALRWFGAIARHPEHGTDCLLCAAGAAMYCGGCFVDAVVERRETLRSLGNPLTGEPPMDLSRA